MIEITFTGQNRTELTTQMEAFLNGQGPATPQPPQAAVTMPAQAPPQATPVPAPAAAEPVQSAPQPQGPIPTGAPTYTREDLMTAGAQLMQKVGMPALQELMTRFGVKAMHELPEAQFGVFAQALREMGGAI